MTFVDRSACLDEGGNGHDGRDGEGRPALRDDPGAAGRKARRPKTAPAYYLGRHVGLWIAVVRPHRGANATAREFETSDQPIADKKGGEHLLILSSTFNI